MDGSLEAKNTKESPLRNFYFGLETFLGWKQLGLEAEKLLHTFVCHDCQLPTVESHVCFTRRLDRDLSRNKITQTFLQECKATTRDSEQFEEVLSWPGHSQTLFAFRLTDAILQHESFRDFFYRVAERAFFFIAEPNEHESIVGHQWLYIGRN